MHADMHKPNWLFRGLMLLSVGVHLILLVHLATIYRPNVVSRIELTLQSIKSRPQPRVVMPPTLPKESQAVFERQPSPIRVNPSRAITAPQFQPPQPIADERLKKLSSLPQIPAIRDPVVTAWEDAPEVVQNALEAPLSVYEHDLDRSERSYTDLLRQKITKEADKEYKRRALRRNLEGVVTVAFIIGRLGELVSINVVSTSGNRILDRAAKKAVKKAAPFDAPPDGSITITLPLKFEQR